MSSAAALLTVLGVAQRFDPRTSLFGHFEPGFDYDFSDTTTLFQDTAGTTPVTGVEQTVALILDKSRGLRLGSELVTNGTFPTNLTGWTTGDGTPTWVAPGAMRLDSTSARQSAWQEFSTVVGATYEVRATLSNFTAGGFAPRMTIWGGAFVTNLGAIGTTAGSFVIRVQAPATTMRVQPYADLGGIADFDNISVRELPGLHQLQSTAASRAVLRSRYNQLTWSEQFDNAAWDNKTNSSITQNAAVAPDGTTTADKLVENTVSGTHNVNQSFSYANQTYVFSAYVAKASERNAMVYMYTASGFAGALLNVANGTASVFSGSVAGTVATAVEVGSYWRVSVTALMPAGAGSANIYAINGTSASYLGDGTSGIFVWGADLRAGNDTIYPYQRITDAATYSTGPQWPTYLEYDGVDDSYASAANLDLTGTDKLTVFAAVTKLSDAATAMVAELSADAGTNAGAFQIRAPNTAAANYLLGVRGSVAQDNITATTYAAPVTNVLTHNGDLSAASSARVNGVAFSGAGGTGGGNFGSYPLFLGRRNNASLPFRGRMYRVIGRGAATPVATISQCERFLARQTGITL